jgi:quinoprotein glucose dehydrogenase
MVKFVIGETPDNIRNHPALKGLEIPRTGRGGLVGLFTTKTLVISAWTFTNPGRQGRRIAQRLMTKPLGKTRARSTCEWYRPAHPMTYMVGGEQYIVIAIGGPGYPGVLVAYRVPN